MEREDFLKKMELIDEKLRNNYKEMYISHRPLEAFMEFETNYEGELWGPSAEILKKTQKPFEGVNLYEEIEKWYSIRYGEKTYINADVGEIPIIIRNEIYSIRIPIVFGAPQINVFKLIDKMTENMIASLKRDEINLIYRAFELGANFYFALDWQINEVAKEVQERITIQSRQFLNRGIEDIKSAISIINLKPEDVQNCCFHTQQAVEKFLKGYLTAFVQIDEIILKKSIGHDFKSLVKKVSEELPMIIDKQEDIDKVDFPMDVRYKYFDISIENGIESIYSCIRICYFILQSIYKIGPVLRANIST